MAGAMPFEEFETIQLTSDIGTYLLTARCLYPNCGWVMNFSTGRLDLILFTCDEHACPRRVELSEGRGSLTA